MFGCRLFAALPSGVNFLKQPPVSGANCWFSHSPDRQTKNYEGLKNYYNQIQRK